MLGNLSVPGRPTDLDYSRARACCACSRCGWGLFDQKFKMAAVPNVVKMINKILQNHQADWADILQEAYGTPPYLK